MLIDVLLVVAVIVVGVLILPWILLLAAILFSEMFRYAAWVFDLIGDADDAA